MEKILLVGLGNVGLEYANTRHNIGFDVLNAFVGKYDGNFKIDKFVHIAEIKTKGCMFYCIKPTTFMNLSGKAFLYWLNYLKLSLDQTLTIVDDIAFSLEILRLKPGGSHGGHNGLKSIQELVQSVQYPKLRFGIGNKYSKGHQVEFVLSKWNLHEQDIVQRKIDFCSKILAEFHHVGLQKTMNVVNAQLF